MAWLWITLIIVSILYLIANYYAQRKAEKEQWEQVELAQEAVSKMKDNLDRISSPIFDSILRSYGEDYVRKISNKTICIGMPAELLLLAWNEPGDIKTNLIRNTNTERWYYDSYYNRLNNLKFKTEVTLENNIIIGWRDLN